MFAVELLDVTKGVRSRWDDRLIDLEIKVLTSEGTEEVWPFTYSPDDNAPMTKKAGAWMSAHPNFKIAAAPKLKPSDYTLNRRNVRSVFIGLGAPANAVDIAIENRPAGNERENLMLAWLEDASFSRDSEIVEMAFNHWSGIDPNLTKKMLDDRWMEIGKMDRAVAPLVSASEAVQH
jgi:hypothetical protein